MKFTVGGSIMRISHLMRRAGSASPEWEQVEHLTGNHGFVLCYLYDHRDQDTFQRDIEERFSMRRSSVSSLLKQMEQNGLVERVSVPTDARLKKLVLTPRAVEANAVIRRGIEETERRMTAGLSPEEQENLLVTLDKIRRNLEQGLFPPEQTDHEKEAMP